MDQLPQNISSEYHTYFINGSTFIYKNGEVDYPIVTNNVGDLIVYNGAGYDFVSYHVNPKSKEIEIRKKIINPKSRKRELFQYIRLSSKEYISLVDNDTIRIKILLGQGYVEYLYNIKSKQSIVIDSQGAGK